MVILIFRQVDVDVVVKYPGFTSVAVIILSQDLVACMYGGNGTADFVRQCLYADIFYEAVPIRLQEMV